MNFLPWTKKQHYWIHKSVVIKSPMSQLKYNTYYYVCKQVSFANIYVGGHNLLFTLKTKKYSVQSHAMASAVGYNVLLEDKIMISVSLNNIL